MLAHDENVTVMSDVGDVPDLRRFLLGADSAATAETERVRVAQEAGERLGSFIARLHSGTVTNPKVRVC